ncbi:hypothetical protein MUK42_27196 [Musa troglodytarum]|uniref:Uncharacterized protein n=1 Tax=Musa troglodytarum TaxID=320322 RepID=A0A9E7F8Y0_9LILI|nr:hypothetical protein MUK42_27196 [Musa troglodytarum]
MASGRRRISGKPTRTRFPSRRRPHRLFSPLATDPIYLSATPIIALPRLFLPGLVVSTAMIRQGSGVRPLFLEKAMGCLLLPWRTPSTVENGGLLGDFVVCFGAVVLSGERNRMNLISLAKLMWLLNPCHAGMEQEE